MLLVLPFLFLIIVLLSLPGTARTRAQARDSARLIAVERKLDLIMQRLEITMPAPEYPDVVRRLEQGKKIHAIKAYRQRTGASLAEAKAAVERIADERGLPR